MDEEANDLRPKFSGLHPLSWSQVAGGMKGIGRQSSGPNVVVGGRKWLDNYVTPYLPIPQLRFGDRSMAALLMEDLRLGFLI